MSENTGRCVNLDKRTYLPDPRLRTKPDTLPPQNSIKTFIPYDISARTTSEWQLGQMSSLACGKDLEISSRLDFFKQNLELTAKSRGSALSNLKKDEIQG